MSHCLCWELGFLVKRGNKTKVALERSDSTSFFEGHIYFFESIVHDYLHKIGGGITSEHLAVEVLGGELEKSMQELHLIPFGS